MIGPRILFLRAGSTDAVAVLASWRPRALAARLDAESLVPLHLLAVAPHAFLSLRELLPLFCAEHQRGPWHLLQGRLAHFLNTHPHWLVAGAHEAPRGGQGDGGDAATAAPSQSVEKVAPAATAEGDGPMSAAGPVAVMAMGSNSPERASKGGVTASAAAPTTQTGTRSAGDGNPPVGRQYAALATVETPVTAGRDRPQSNAGYANPIRRKANGEDAGVTSPGGEQPGTLSRFGASDLEQGLNGNEPAAPLRGPRLPGAGQESPAPFTLIAGGR